jgi:hypothetical protein
MKASVVHLSPTVVWPVLITQPAYSSTDETVSQLRYAEYLEYQGNFWHFWAGLSAVFLAFAFWFRDRSMVEVLPRQTGRRPPGERDA